MVLRLPACSEQFVPLEPQQGVSTVHFLGPFRLLVGFLACPRTLSLGATWIGGLGLLKHFEGEETSQRRPERIQS